MFFLDKGNLLGRYDGSVDNNDKDIEICILRCGLVIGLCEVAILFLFDVDTVARRRMYGANQVIENQWGGDEDNDDDAGDDGDEYNDDDFKCSIFCSTL